MEGSSHTRFEPGDIVASRYRIEEELGRGGMGLVLRAIDLQLNRPVAVQVLDLNFIYERMEAHDTGPVLTAAG